MKIVEILKPVIIAPLIKKFCEKYPEAGLSAFQTAQQMRQTMLSLPTYLRAVKNDENKRIAYMWAYPLGEVLFVQQVYSEHPKAFKRLEQDMVKWATIRGYKKIIGLVDLKLLGPARKRWHTKYGYKEVSVMVEKTLGGDNGGHYEKDS